MDKKQDLPSNDLTQGLDVPQTTDDDSNWGAEPIENQVPTTGGEPVLIPVEPAVKTPDVKTPDTDADEGDDDSEQPSIEITLLQNLSDESKNVQVFLDTKFDKSWQDFVWMLAPYKQDDIVALLGRLNPEVETYDEAFFNKIFANRTQEEITNFFLNMAQAINYVYPGKGLEGLVADPAASFANGVVYKGKIKEPSAAGTLFDETKDENKPGAYLSALAAVARYRQLTEKGEFQDIWLPLTGCQIRMSIAGDDEHITLNETISKEIATIGRRTTGAVFSNTNILVERACVDFILSRVTRTSLSCGPNKDKLKELIAAPDIDFLLTKYAAGRFSRGYPLRVICNASDACHHEEEHAVDLNKFIWVANGRLTETQRAMAFRKPSEIKDGDVTYYQKEHRWHQYKQVTLSTGLIIHLKVPTYTEKEKGGIEWIEKLENMAQMALDNSYNAKQREDFIKRQAAATSLYQYLPWIEKLEIPSGAEGSEGYYVEGDAMRQTLVELNQEPVERNELFDKINEFINNALVGVIGYPRWACGECKGLQPERSEVIPAIWPINALHTFFTLITNGIRRNLRDADIY